MAFCYLGGGSFTTIDVPNATATSAFGINAVGQIAGPFNNPSNITHGFLATPVNVQSVVFEAINSPLDHNPNAGGGLRIFPDKQSPTDTLNRRRVRVKATLNAAVAGVTVFFRSFDIDDPSSDIAPIDPNGPAGNDNQGMPQEGTLICPKTPCSAQTDVNGVAQVEFEVTTNPGDNFKVAASLDQEYLNGVVVDPVDGVNLKDANGNILPTPKAKVTDMLTVWRRVHIEVDSMGLVTGNNVTGTVLAARPNAVLNLTELDVDQTLETDRFENGRIDIFGVGAFTVLANRNGVVVIDGIVQNADAAGKPFTLVDDDDFNSNDGANLRGDEGEDVVALGETFSPMADSLDNGICDYSAQNVFGPAYICPVYDGGGNPANDTGNIDFNLNVPNLSDDVDKQINLGRNSDPNESDAFWVIYLQIGYQSDVNTDGDPNSEFILPNQAVTGATPSFGSADDIASCAGVPRGGEGSLVYIETSRDVDVHGAAADTRIRTAPHEVGHQFGLKGDVDGFGIMSDSGPLEFVPAHINILRCRVKSPGQP